MDREVDQPPQLPAQILDVDTGTAIDLGRVLAREKRDAQTT
jgi:hypothetical protein